MSDFAWWQNTIIFSLIAVLILSWTDILGPLDRFWNNVFEGWNLKQHEQLVFDTWKKCLTEEEKTILHCQMQNLSFFQRGGGQTKILFFYGDEKSLRLFDNTMRYNHVATVSLEGNEPSPFGPINVKIFLQEGRFFSIEFPKRPKRMAEQRGWTLDRLRPTGLIVHRSVSERASGLPPG